MKRENNFSSLFRAKWGGGGGEWKSNSRERKSNFSLDFPVFGPSDFIRPRNKVVLHGKGYAWAPVLLSFNNSER